MEKHNLFKVSSLHRYPVKSMGGEQLQSVEVTECGLAGDRAYALVDTAGGKVGSAKNVRRFGELLRWHAQFLDTPSAEKPSPPVKMMLPDGRVLESHQPATALQLAAMFGPDIRLSAGAPEGLILEFAAGTLGGQHAQTTQLPVSSGAPKGTLFNYAAVHLITTATLRELKEDPDRFRPNIIVDTGDHSGFPENSWVGQCLAIGDEVVVRVSIPCPRCVVPTLPRRHLPHDAAALRQIAELNTLDLGDFGKLPCVGVYAEVVRGGQIRQDDVLRVM